jgi:serine/threonine-protein kinase
MSPEQAMGSSSIDHRTDLYSLGTMLFEMLAGGLPYAGQNFTEFFAKLLTEEPRSPRDVYPGFPVEAEPLVRKAIRKKPEERFQSASEMLEALAQLPGFATRAESLARVSSGMVRKSFAAGDLGEGEWHTKKKRDSAYTTSRARPDAQGGQLSQATTDVATKRRSRLGVVVVATLVLLVVAFGLWKWTSPGASASATGNLPAPPSLPAPDQPPSATATPPPAASKTSEPIVPAPSLPESTAKPAEPKGAAARGKKSRPGPTQLRRGGRGTVMSEQFE